MGLGLCALEIEGSMRLERLNPRRTRAQSRNISRRADVESYFTAQPGTPNGTFKANNCGSTEKAQRSPERGEW
jgi:hypothetical protein